MPSEKITEPDLPIIDAHHHLWWRRELAPTGSSLTEEFMGRLYRQSSRYLWDEFMADVNSGHRVSASVFVDSRAMYRESGPTQLRSLGEVEFVSGLADVATGGDAKICAGIVSSVDLRPGDAVEEVLLAHVQVGQGRCRGIRCPNLAHDEDTTLLGSNTAAPGQLLRRDFRRGFSHLRSLGLSFDVWLLEPQLPDLIDLAREFSETQIVLNHMGSPILVARYASHMEESLASWRGNMRALARCENVAVKLSGIGMPFWGREAAKHWPACIQFCIDTFGVERCMFASNFPVDSLVMSYADLWNFFKDTVVGATDHEKATLFSGTAARIYRIAL